MKEHISTNSHQLIPSPVRFNQRGVLQRKCSCEQHTVAGDECTECRKKRQSLQRKTANHQAGPATAPPIVHEVLRSPGRPLDQDTRTFMESRFSHDFSGVRVHTDTKADSSARAVNSLAYTVGQNMVFSSGQYAPETNPGRRLLAHELTHVVQQSRTRPQLQGLLMVGQPQDRYEREAGRMAEQVAAHPSSLIEGRKANMPPSTMQLSKLTAQRTAVMQRAVSTQCFPPSLFLTPPAAAGFGIIAEKFVELDFCSKIGCGSGDHYFENSFAGPIDPRYAAFIIRHNGSTLASWAVVAISTMSLKRPDIIVHKPGLQEFYEIKPNSPSGLIAAVEKVLLIDLYMRAFGLPYIRGVAYKPTGLTPIMVTTVAGTPFEIFFRAQRPASGIVVYDLCIKTDWLKVSIAVLMVVMAILLAILLRGARIPRGGPMPVPQPIIAGRTGNEGETASEMTTAVT